MTNHLVGSFTCPLNPIFGSIREQIKYLCCLLEVQGFISLCDCFMQRLGDCAVLSTPTARKLILGSVSKFVSQPTMLFIQAKRYGFSVIKLCLTLLLSLLKRCGFCKDTVTLSNWNSGARLIGDACGDRESHVDIKGKCTLPFGRGLQLKLEQHFMSECCFLSPQGLSLIETLHTEPGTRCDVLFLRTASVKRL